YTVTCATPSNPLPEYDAVPAVSSLPQIVTTRPASTSTALSVSNIGSGTLLVTSITQPGAPVSVAPWHASLPASPWQVSTSHGGGPGLRQQLHGHPRQLDGRVDPLRRRGGRQYRPDLDAGDQRSGRVFDRLPGELRCHRRGGPGIQLEYRRSRPDHARDVAGH